MESGSDSESDRFARDLGGRRWEHVVGLGYRDEARLGRHGVAEGVEAADDIVSAMEATIADKIVTYDFARLMEGATEVKTSEFAAAIVDRL